MLIYIFVCVLLCAYAVLQLLNGFKHPLINIISIY